MRFQRASFDCAIASMFNAGLALGVVLDYRQLVEESGADEDGTDEIGVLQALRNSGLSSRPFSSDNRNEAWAWLKGQLLDGRPVILCLSSWRHWVCIGGLLGNDRVILIDSSRSSRNKRENGIHVVSYSRLQSQWWNARRWADGERRLYAICVGRQ